MGLAASQARLLMIVARKSDIEFQIQCINQRRIILANAASNLTRQYANNVFQTGDWIPSGPVIDDTNPASGYGLPGIGDIFAPGGEDGDEQQVGTTPIASGNYEVQLSAVHAQDKELELRQKNA